MVIDAFEEFPDKATIDEYWSSFRPFVARTAPFSPRIDVADFAGSATEIDVSYTLGDNDTLQGDPKERLFCMMKASAFAARFVAVEDGRQTHASPGQPRYYVSQVPLFSARGQPAPLSEHFGLPIVPMSIADRKLESVNVWINIEQSHTSLHYDSFHNFLVVAKGSKTVYMTSPKNTIHLSPNAAYSGVANHSSLSLARGGAQPVRRVARVQLAAGDCLFIPEGWWHEVTSAPLTVAQVRRLMTFVFIEGKLTIIRW